ncbi:hypothetical protein AOQ84DRAFT_383298 [Glonium stellatum]|uniref:DUF6594 domain-containing protein n=1 Tax=Glonium stellatum TaxID=574774 RepID=A0A8E2ENR8_9PEZI|nr:hypothetical protein AOQ84DRAFT_383298 [Glonium stellatum]
MAIQRSQPRSGKTPTTSPLFFHEIDELDDEARRSADYEARQSSRRWETLTKLGEDLTRPEKKRLDKAKELQGKMKEYQEALLQARTIQLSGPSDRVLSAFRDYLGGEAREGSGLQSAPIISGRAKDMLNKEDGLVALREVVDEDIFSILLRNHWVFQKRTTLDPLDRTTMYKGQHVVWTVAQLAWCAPQSS